MFCGNDKVFDGALTCALSIMKRSKLSAPLKFYLLTMDVSHIKPEYLPISAEQTVFFEEVVKRYNPENSVERIDVTSLYMEEFAGSSNESAYCSPYTLIRLLADRVEGIPDKILYLDIDVMFNRDVQLLYNIDVSDVEYAAARDHYGKYLINPNYVNAGVMLWNMKKMRETGLLVKARELIRQKKLTFADQSAIIRSTTKKKMLPQKFNDQKFLHKHTVVRHFSKRLFWLPYPHTANIKQWHVEKVHKIFKYTQFDDILDEYTELVKQFRSKYPC
jgi:lipopolysaccharide biosynthesis glycosyltransferase